MAESDAAAGPTRCGFVAIVGAPNAGKSTLTNQLVGAKVSIVTHKVQTTRARVLGIAIVRASQVVLVDTPGIFTPRLRLERAMVNAAWQGVEDADLTAVLVDVSRPRSVEAGLGVVDRLAETERRAILIMNKIDLVKRERLLEISALVNARREFEQTFMVSALSGDGVGRLRDWIADALPEGPWLFPEDQISNMPQRLLAAEIVREKLFLTLHQELPYELTVEPEGWENFKDGSVKVGCVIYVRRENQKGIVLGKGGQRIRDVGAAAREELREILGRQTHLFLFVKVRGGWVDDPERYREMGLEFFS